MSAPIAPPGLLHAAVLSREPDEVLSRCLPDLRRVATGGDEIELYADRRHGRVFREGMPDATMHFPSPVGRSALGLAHELAARTGLGAVVGTACAEAVSSDGPDEAVHAENALTLLLADLPLSVFCIYDPTDADAVRVARATHPWLLTDEGRVVNPDFRPPATSSPVPSTVVGPALLDLAVPDGSLLAGMRPQIAARARSEGLGEEQVDETVLAAHEALLVAGGACLDGPAPSDLPPGDHRVVLRRARRGIVAECRGAPPQGQDRGEQSDRLVALSRLYDGLAVHDDVDGRLVRVLVAPHRGH